MKKIEFEQSGPMAFSASDVAANIFFKKIKTRIGARLVSERERRIKGGAAGRSSYETNNGQVVEWIAVRLNGVDSTIRKRLYFDDSLSVTVNEVLEELR